MDKIFYNETNCFKYEQYMKNNKYQQKYSTAKRTNNQHPTFSSKKTNRLTVVNNLMLTQVSFAYIVTILNSSNIKRNATIWKH